MKMVSEEAFIDLSKLVKRLRTLALARVRIPAHSGKADAQTRKDQRAERRDLAEQLDSTKEEIVSWALQQIPPEQIDET